MGYDPILFFERASTRAELNFFACYPKRATTREKPSLKLEISSWATTHAYTCKTENLRKTWATTQINIKTYTVVDMKKKYEKTESGQRETYIIIRQRMGSSKVGNRSSLLFVRRIQSSIYISMMNVNRLLTLSHFAVLVTAEVK